MFQIYKLNTKPSVINVQTPIEAHSDITKGAGLMIGTNLPMAKYHGRCTELVKKAKKS